MSAGPFAEEALVALIAAYLLVNYSDSMSMEDTRMEEAVSDARKLVRLAKGRKP